MSSKSIILKFLQPLNSMAARLTILVVLTSALILLFMTSTMKRYLNETIRQEEIRFLSETSYILEDLFRRQGNDLTRSPSSAFIRQLDQEINTVHLSKLELLIETQGHRILLKTPEFDNISPELLHQLLSQKSKQRQNDPIAFSKNNLDYLMISHILKLPGNSEQTRFYLVLDITRNNQLIQSFEEKLNIILVFGLFSTLLLGFLVTYLGLSPLREISHEVSTLTPTDFNRRIDRPSWPHELRRLSISFDGMLARSQRAFQQLSQFSADVAHEFRTPITNLKGETEVALSQPRMPEEYQELLHSQLEEYDRLTQMIDKLLFLARTEANETQLHKTQFYLESEIRKVLEYFEPVVVEKNIQVHISGNAMITADQAMMRRVIGNLISNALKHMDDNGKIDIKINPMEDLSIQMSVQDTGCGIPQEHLAHIFDRFYRVDSVRQHHEGTGLGLSIVQSIMAQHHGSIRIESEPGVGTTVILSFPVIQPSSNESLVK